MARPSAAAHQRAACADATSERLHNDVERDGARRPSATDSDAGRTCVLDSRGGRPGTSAASHFTRRTERRVAWSRATFRLCPRTSWIIGIRASVARGRSETIRLGRRLQRGRQAGERCRIVQDRCAREACQKTRRLSLSCAVRRIEFRESSRGPPRHSCVLAGT